MYIALKKKKKKTKSWGLWFMPAVPATQRLKSRGPLESRCSGLA